MWEDIVRLQCRSTAITKLVLNTGNVTGVQINSQTHIFYDAKVADMTTDKIMHCETKHQTGASHDGEIRPQFQLYADH